MTPQPDNPPAFPFECPLCGGAFEADHAMLGQEVECPHCGQAVELPTAEEAGVGPAPPEETPAKPPAPAPQPLASQPPDPQPAASRSPQPRASQSTGAAPPRPLTREERAAARRRLNLILAAVGAVVLVATFVVLASLS